MTNAAGGLRPIPDILEHLNAMLKAGMTADIMDTGADILDLVAAELTEYVALPNESALVTATLWTMHTWFVGILSTTPRLLLVSPEPGSGKSNLLKVMRHLVPLGVRSENATPAWVYHEMESRRDENAVRPTIMLDEFDCLSPAGKDNVEMRRIIDAGAYVGGTVNRHIGKNNVDFDVFGPMAIAGNMLAGQVHRAILSRSLVLQMQKARKNQVPTRWYERSSPAQVEPLREPLRRWAALVMPTAKEHKPSLPDEVWNRDSDLWEPLILCADMAGGAWPELARVTAVTAVTAVDNDPSPGILLLETTRAIFNGADNTNPSVCVVSGSADRQDFHPRHAAQAGENRPVPVG